MVPTCWECIIARSIRFKRQFTWFSPQSEPEAMIRQAVGFKRQRFDYGPGLPGSFLLAQAFTPGAASFPRARFFSPVHGAFFRSRLRNAVKDGAEVYRSEPPRTAA